ncbi:MAG: ATP-grasp domain-containing protein [Deltaproteobacteria bacterium]|nr:ATP-grasp domain-containing protein [Deltaproteobacteria bacterium]
MTNLSGKRLMVLGAGPFQLPGIRRAVDLGCWVATVDNLPGNHGHGISHQRIHCSTLDKGCVLEAARAFEIDGICTFSSDVATPTVAYVCDELILVGSSLESTEAMVSKDRFRSFQKRHGLNHPAFVVGERFRDVASEVGALGYPVVFKPCDSSGSRGIASFETFCFEKMMIAFDLSRSFSRSGRVVIEERLDGVEVGGDGFWVGGEAAFLCITHKRLEGFAPKGHCLPTGIDEANQERVREALTRCCAALSYTDGPLNFDVMVSPERVTIIEMSPRTGGNGIPALIRRATGVDVEEATILRALGKEVVFPEPSKALRSCGSYIIGSRTAGVLAGLPSFKEIQAVVPGLYESFFTARPGEIVPKFEHGGHMLGWLLFDCDSPQAYETMARTLDVRLKLDISEQPPDIRPENPTEPSMSPAQGEARR